MSTYESLKPYAPKSKRRVGGALGIVVTLLASCTGLALSASASQALDQALTSSIQTYESRYPLPDPMTKLIDDKGRVPDIIKGKDRETLSTQLQGVRNFRYVLNGVLYRGGKINPDDTPKKNNQNAMSLRGLNNLCAQGFGEIVYLYYDKKLSVRPRSIACTTLSGQPNTLIYKDLPPLGSPVNVKAILADIYEALKDDGDHRPLYVHCWNGWHASGYISAIALRQFCGFTADDAVKYWNINTDGVCKGSSKGKIQDPGKTYDKVRQQISAYDPAQSPNLKLNPETAEAVCPSPRSLDAYRDPCPASLQAGEAGQAADLR